MSFYSTYQKFMFFIPLGLGTFILSGCLTGYHSSLASPPAPKVEQDFDLAQLPRFQADINAYSQLVEGNVSASLAAAAAGAPCPTASASGPATKLLFCIQDGKLVVEVLDKDDKFVGNATNLISISSTPLGVTGAATVAANKGVATFDQLYLNSSGAYKLAANADGLASATTASFAVALNLDRAKYFRNKITDNFMGDIDHVYGEYTNALYIGRGFQAVETDFLNLGLTTASAISLVTRTKTILSSLASGVAGVNLSFDKNFFGQQTFAALAIAMQARRDQARSTIYKNEQLSVTEYSLAAARRDLISYFFSGTLPGAIQEIQEEAATKSAAATKETAGAAAKLAFAEVHNGAVGTALSVQVQVQDSEGKLVGSATNAITISSTPSGVTGTLTSNAAAGVATFSLTFPATGTFTLKAESTNLTSATSSPITIVSAGSPIPPTTPTPTTQRSTQGLH